MPDPQAEPAQPPASDPFALLGLEPRVDLDPAAVDRAYLARAAACHPDLAGDDPEKAAQAARRAAALNRARAVLLDPESRVRALLARLGWVGGKALPDGFLMEIMETRMAIEEAVASGDAAEIARWREWAARERRSSIDRITDMFAGLASPPAASSIDGIGCQLNAWRYIERLLEQIKP